MSRAEHAVAALRGAALGLAILPLAAMASDQCTVIQRYRAFSEARVAIARGGILHFSNEDDFTHEIYVESPDFSYESDEQEPGTIVSVRFPDAGHFVVRCHIHPKMHLDVDVQ